MMQINRKEFLQTLAVGGAAAAVGQFGNLDVFAQTGQTGVPDLVAIMGGEPEAMFQKAIAELGGMEKFVKKGQKIVVKPNIGWSQPPEFAANTHPGLVKEIVKQAYAAGASEVIVFDTTCDNQRDCYEKSGIEAAALEAGAKVLPTGKGEVHQAYYTEVDIPNGKVLKKAMIHKALVECDAWINVPVLKVHNGGGKMTIAMKNYMGIVHNPQFFHRNGLHQCIADICTWEKKPVLNVVDAYRIMKSNGPRGRSEADAVVVKALFAATDFVAVDTAATKMAERLTNIPVSDVEHIVIAESMKLGTMDLEKLNIKRITV